MKTPSAELISWITDIDTRQILAMKIEEDELIVTYNEQCKYQNPADTYDNPFDLYRLMSICKKETANCILELRLESSLTAEGGYCRVLNKNGDELFMHISLYPYDPEKNEYYHSEIDSVFHCYQWFMDNSREMIEILHPGFNKPTLDDIQTFQP